MADVMKPFPIGQRGTATYKENWGMPIAADGVWRGDPSQTASPMRRPTEGSGLIKPLPQAQTDPRGFVDNQFEQFKGRYKQIYKRLRQQHGNDAESFNRDLAKLDAEAIQYEAQHANTLAQIDYLQGLVDSGLDVEAGRRAMERAAGIPSPTVPSTRGVTPSHRGMSTSQVLTMTKNFEEMIQDSMVNLPGWGKAHRKHADPNMLEDMFNDQWDILNLDDPYNANLIPGFIRAWKSAITSNGHYTKGWRQVLDAGSVETLLRFAPTNAVNRALRNKIANVQQDPGIGPLGKGIINQLPVPGSRQPKDQPPTDDPLGIR